MDILDRIAAYDCSDGGHSDAAQGSAYDLMSDAADEIKQLRATLSKIAGGTEDIDPPYRVVPSEYLRRLAREALPPTHR